MMKQIFVFFSLILAVLSATPQNAETKTVDPAFLVVYNQVLELNKDRFDDINLIQIGDTVLFPAKSGVGVEYYVAADKTQNGTHDCIWVLTEKYLRDAFITKLMPQNAVWHEDAPKINNNPKWKEALTLPIVWFVIFIIILCITVMVWAIPLNRKRLKNPNYYPDVLGNLSAQDINNTANKIATRLTEEERILHIERGYLIRESGPKKILVVMEFGDNKNREVYLESGEKVTKVTIQNENGHSHQEFWREHCGNYFAVIKSGRVMVPQGWKFVKEEEQSFVEKSDELSTDTTTENKTETAPATITLTNGQKMTGTVFIDNEDKDTKISFLINEANKDTL